MNDRELIERAAKAAGIGWQMYDYEKLRSLKHMVCKRDMWNPLENDGEVFRLAAQLNIQVEYGKSITAYSLDGSEHFSEDASLDKLTAKRRAITRAAASMCATTGEG